MRWTIACPQCAQAATCRHQEVGVTHVGLNWAAPGLLYTCPNGHVLLSFDQCSSDVLTNALAAQTPAAPTRGVVHNEPR